MSPRPPVSVVMPFAGTLAEAQDALATLARLGAGPEDELILSDNSGVAPAHAAVTVIPAPGEGSPSHARNVGAEHATRDWILFLDADCIVEPGLLDAYFATPIDPEVGALAGEVFAAEGATLAARYGASRGFLGLSAHLAHPYLPRAAAANLLVRRSAFETVGGFYEGLRAAEDTDFTWRLQRAGYQLQARPQARVRHRYRTSLEALRRQWRGYAAGRAWLSRRYEDFEPQPAVVRATRRLVRPRTAAPRRVLPAPTGSPPPARRPSRGERGAYLAIDALLGLEELAGFALSNRPRAASDDARAQVVVVADRFPARGDPLSDYARRLQGARVEAAGRPETIDPRAARELTVSYREDDGMAARGLALGRLWLRHPLRAGRDVVIRGAGEPSLPALAPAAVRLARDREARVHALGGAAAAAVARRLARLTGRTLTEDSEP